jgi:uncharacterized protein DUF488
VLGEQLAARAAVGGFIAYLAEEVLPHAAAEEKAIYPLAVLTDGGAAAGQARQIAELFAAHAAKENNVLLPVLLDDATVDLIHHVAGHHTVKKSMRIRVRRVYDMASADNGFRVLVDRVKPRGLSKDAARLDEWAKDQGIARKDGFGKHDRRRAARSAR